MKLVFYDDFKLGAVIGDAVVDLSDAVADIVHTSPQDLLNQLIERFPDYRPNLQQAIDGGPRVPVGQVRIRPPVPSPTNIVAMAVNYMENGTRSEPAPINAFHKSANAIIGPGDTMVLPDVPGTIFEGEAEIAFVIGKRASNVRAEDAYDHIFGYLNFIDGSARGLPPDGNTFYQMKSRETFAPMGPWLVTADEVPDPLNLQVRLWVNEDLKQDYNTSDMAHKIPQDRRVGQLHPHAQPWRRRLHRHQPPRPQHLHGRRRRVLRGRGPGHAPHQRPGRPEADMAPRNEAGADRKGARRLNAPDLRQVRRRLACPQSRYGRTRAGPAAAAGPAPCRPMGTHAYRGQEC